MSRRKWTWSLVGIAAFVGIAIWLRSQITLPPEQADPRVGMRTLFTASFDDADWFQKWLIERDFRRRPHAYVGLYVRFAKEGGYYGEGRGLIAPIEFYHGLLAYGQDPDPRVRLNVVYAFAFTPHRRDLKGVLEPLIAALLQDTDQKVVQGAIDLADACGPPSGEAIRQLVYSEDARTRLAAAKALARVFTHSEPDREDLRAIEHLLADEDEGVRKVAQYALRRLKGTAP